MRPYAVFVHEDVLTLLMRARGRCALILNFIEQIAADPYLAGDFKDSDDIGRPLEVKLVGSYAITYWADHAVKEIKIINVEPAGS